MTFRRRQCAQERSYGSIDVEVTWLFPMHHANLYFRALAIAGVVACTAVANAVECRDITHQKVSFSVCRVDLAIEKLEIFYLDGHGKPLANFENVTAELAKTKYELLFAINGGMFDKKGKGLRPLGLLVAGGKKIKDINLNGWPRQPPVPPEDEGNFYKIPNAVFSIQGGKAEVTDSLGFSAKQTTPEIAVQSGPMVVQGGKIPEGLRDYNAKTYNRNGVCAPTPTTAAFVISNQLASIRQLALFMRDELNCSDALYLDGCRSALFSKSLRRNDKSCPNSSNQARPMGPMIGVTAPASGKRTPGR
jgi:uncharacterized protein YigE (DUF2233 family)